MPIEEDVLNVKKKEKKNSRIKGSKVPIKENRLNKQEDKWG